METLEWPDGVSKPEFMTREYGKTTGERTSRDVRDASSFELWTSLFADDCVLLFQSRDELIRGSSRIFAHLRKFGLCMHVGRGDAASKTEAMYFPPPRTAYEAADRTRLAFTLMAPASLISVRSSSTWVQFSITRLSVMLMLIQISCYCIVRGCFFVFRVY